MVTRYTRDALDRVRLGPRRRRLAFGAVLVVAWAVGCGDDARAPVDGSADVALDVGVNGDASPPDGSPSVEGGLGAHCDAEGATRCTDAGEQRCVSGDNGLVWGAATACEHGCGVDRCVTCEDRRGQNPAQSLEVDGETRTYFLYVPESFDCDADVPVWFDFHGTAGDGAEIAYGLEAQLAIAEREGVVVVRPRSRSRAIEGPIAAVYQWDVNAGDLPRNEAFVRALARELGNRMHIDPARFFASGFSSGANMTSRFLGAEAPRFSGFGFVAGGTWSAPTLGSLAESTARIYGTTGYRDYIYNSWEPLAAMLDAAAFPRERLFFRESDTGHELYPWHYDEMWAYLAEGARPPAGTLAARYVPEPRIDTDATLLELASDGAGGHLVVGRGAGLFHLGADGGGETLTLGSAAEDAHFTAACVAASGRVFALGDEHFATAPSLGAPFDVRRTPFIDGGMAPSAFLNGLTCAGDRAVAVGYWASAATLDGVDFEAVSMRASGYPAQAAAAATHPITGTTIAVGYYDYVGRLTDGGAAFDAASLPISRHWYNDVAVGPDGTFWIVGDAGGVLRSTDDGATFEARPVEGGDDLYGVAFRDADVGLAVGAHGHAYLTRDAGRTWEDASTGLDAMLADVAFLADGAAVLVGEGGLALRTEITP